MWQHWSSSLILDISFHLNYTSFEIDKQMPFQVALLVYLYFLPFSFFNFQMELMILTSKNFCGFPPSNHSIIMLKERKRNQRSRWLSPQKERKKMIIRYYVLFFIIFCLLSISQKLSRAFGLTRFKRRLCGTAKIKISEDDLLFPSKLIN